MATIFRSERNSLKGVDPLPPKPPTLTPENSSRWVEWATLRQRLLEFIVRSERERRFESSALAH